MKNLKKFWIIGGVILVIVFVLIIAMKQKDTNSTENILKKNVQTKIVQLETIKNIAQFSTTVAGEEETIISPKMMGHITKIKKEAGDKIYKGEVLATIDGSEVWAQVGAAQDGVNSLKKMTDDTDDYYDQTVDEAKEALKTAEKTYKAFKNTNPTDEEKDIAKQSVKQAEEAVRSAKRMRDLQNRSAETQLISAEGQLKMAHSQARNTTLRAPYAGIITSQLANLGSLVSPGQAVFTVAKSEKKEVNISVASQIARDLVVDQIVEIEVDGIADKITGRIISISPLADSVSRKSAVKIGIENGENLRLGDFARVLIQTDIKQNVIVVPVKSILKEYYDNFVFVDNDGVAEKRKVEVGITEDDKVEIKSGLSVGEMVITEGQFYLQDGDLVE
jgi:RND family efflux transporter MFP subunit